MDCNYQYNLGQLFDKVARENSDKTAINLFEGNDVTYNTVNVLSNKIANFLLSKSIGRNDVVAILNNKTAMSYSIMIACLKIGAVYTNLDPKSPIERFNKMVEICNPKLLFYYSDENNVMSEFKTDKFKSINYANPEFIKEVNVVGMDFPAYNREVTANTPAYIMFTSGSTGFPKGVVISHQNILNFIEWSRTIYNTTTDDVFTNINPMHFDNSVFDFYASLFTGASIVPVGENLTRNPRKLVEALNQVLPTIWFSVPSMLVYMLNMRALKETDLPTLRVVTYGGEGFPKNQLRKLWKYWGHSVRFVNVYGPTECTCICSSYDVSAKDIEKDELLPLGHMAPNFYGLVVNDDGKKVQLGEIGELYIGGPNVGIGYYNDIKKTEEFFIGNPGVESHKEIVYKSGDLVKQDPDTKMFLFCGRKDNQIKRMGYRMELEEIEHVINSIDFIKESAVVYIDNKKYSSKIIACLNSSDEDDNKIAEILRKYLPSYMLPDLYFYFRQLPKNQNGKIDRLKLKEELNQ